jgi:D-alanyl-D-alanine carboxypeptidase
MRTTAPASQSRFPEPVPRAGPSTTGPAASGTASIGYGLGLVRFDTSCGTVGGHGDVIGHHSITRFSADGRRGLVADVTTQPDISTAASEKVVAFHKSVYEVDHGLTCRMFNK